MDIVHVPFSAIDWDTQPTTEHAGETGKAYWRTVEMGNIRVRRVTYSPGYRADHWCNRGHVLLVLEGTLITELGDGRIFELCGGRSYQVADGAEPHRSATETGVELFIVD